MNYAVWEVSERELWWIQARFRIQILHHIPMMVMMMVTTDDDEFLKQSALKWNGWKCIQREWIGNLFQLHAAELLPFKCTMQNDEMEKWQTKV